MQNQKRYFKVEHTTILLNQNVVKILLININNYIMLINFKKDQIYLKKKFKVFNYLKKKKLNKLHQKEDLIVMWLITKNYTYKIE